MDKKLILYATCTLGTCGINAGFTSLFSGSKHAETVSQEASFGVGGSLIVKAHDGPISVQGWSKHKIVVHADKKAKTEEQAQATEVEVQKGSDNSYTVATKYTNTKQQCPVTYTVMVPHKTNVTARNKHGKIAINDIHGAIIATSKHGDITVDGAHQSVMAKTERGIVKTAFVNVPVESKIFLSTDRGNVEASLPAATQSAIEARAERGMVTSDHDVTLRSKTTPLNRATYKKMAQNIEGWIGGNNDQSSAHITMQTKRGSIRMAKAADTTQGKKGKRNA